MRILCVFDSSAYRNDPLTGEMFSRSNVVYTDVRISQVGISTKGVIVQFFLQRFTSLFFSAGTLLGILLLQPYDIWLLVLLGWFAIPIDLLSLPFGYNSFANQNDQWPEWAVWIRWGVVFYYVLLLLCCGWCSYRTTRQTGAPVHGHGVAGRSGWFCAREAVLNTNRLLVHMPHEYACLSWVCYSAETGQAL